MEHQEEERTAQVDVVHRLTSKRLAEAFHLVEAGLSILDEGNPNSEQSSKVSRNMSAAIQ
jgi:hypothetical protein